MFSPEDTIIGFIAGLSGRSVNDLDSYTELGGDLDFQADELNVLCSLIAAEYQLWIPYGDAILWVTVQDVIHYVERHLATAAECNAGVDMLPEVVS